MTTISTTIRGYHVTLSYGGFPGDQGYTMIQYRQFSAPWEVLTDTSCLFAGDDPEDADSLMVTTSAMLDIRDWLQAYHHKTNWSPDKPGSV